MTSNTRIFSNKKTKIKRERERERERIKKNT